MIWPIFMRYRARYLSTSFFIDQIVLWISLFRSFKFYFLQQKLAHIPGSTELQTCTLVRNVQINQRWTVRTTVRWILPKRVIGKGSWKGLSWKVRYEIRKNEVEKFDLKLESRVQSRVDDPDESRRSWGFRADYLLSKSGQSCWWKQTILVKTDRKTIFHIVL